MGLLDQLGGMMGGKSDDGQDSGTIGLVSKLINDNGGLGGLVQKLKDAGLDKQVGSWIGLGQNEAISGEQVEAAVGPDKIGEIAKSLGIDKSAALAKISEYLPKIIDKLSPTGQLPPDSFVGKAIEALKQNLPAS